MLYVGSSHCIPSLGGSISAKNVLGFVFGDLANVGSLVNTHCVENLGILLAVFSSNGLPVLAMIHITLTTTITVKTYKRKSLCVPNLIANCILTVFSSVHASAL